MLGFLRFERDTAYDKNQLQEVGPFNPFSTFVKYADNPFGRQQISGGGRVAKQSQVGEHVYEIVPGEDFPCAD